MKGKGDFVLWFNQLSIEDVPLVGGKNASLGEMYRELKKKGVTVPNGFAVTAYAYNYFLEKAKIKSRIKEILKGLDSKNIDDLMSRGEKVRALVVSAQMPPELESAITKAYAKLCKEYGNYCDVAVRSSATAEDLPDASFAGQQETYLNIRGNYELIEACKKCLASLFTNRAISYREANGYDHFSIALSIGVQKMVRSDKACSGVMFTIDTESGFREVVLINGAYGLGENIVKGTVNPDRYYVFKPTLKKGYRPVISKKLGNKELMMVYSHDGSKSPTFNARVPDKMRKEFVLTDDEVLTLAKWGCIIEDHYSKKAKHFKPMDIEWAKDGKLGKLFIVQARPETVQSQRDVNSLDEYVLDRKGKVLVTGESIGNKIGAGGVHVIEDVRGITRFRPGEVLVTDMTDPDWVPIMKVASAIITNRGGRTCHAAIVSREMGIPCIVGTENATGVLKKGAGVTVDCSKGETGYVYEGIIPFKIKTTDLTSIPKTKTKVMMNIATPEQALEKSFLPNDGVGLAREEFIINSLIKVHPLALLNYQELKKKKKHSELIKKIDELTEGYQDKSQFFVDKLAQGVAMIGAAFYPKDVIVRFSDFKTNEYRNLIGGDLYEPEEENPMIGWRGASRYYSDSYKKAFLLECHAIKKVREVFGLSNVKTMVPFCRTVEEGRRVLRMMESGGLRRGEKGLEVYVMCEIPSNVILADQFSEIFDGFSIGSNDLTQLTLGLDRDSTLVAKLYDERNEAVKRLISEVIKVAKKRNRKIGICGQAPSDFPDFAQFLVEQGIDSISLNPDCVIKTKLRIAEREGSMGERSIRRRVVRRIRMVRVKRPRKLRLIGRKKKK